MSQPLHLRGVVLPQGEPRELWIADGTIHTEPVPGAQTICTEGWIMSGLVDAHCHIGLGIEGAVSVETARAQAVADRNAGVLLIRDAGSPSDTHWIDDEAGLPRIVRAGQHIAAPRRYLRNLGVEVPPEQLADQVEIEARRGDGWVKLVGDWIDRSAGDIEPLWPADIAAQAIARAHQVGARVTAHCFAEQSVQELVRAGIDGIEHGTGLDDDTIALMAEAEVALVPTLININNFPQYAEPAKQKFPNYFAHMEDLYRRRRQTVGKAREAGVGIYAGTDAGTVIKHGRVPDEIIELAKVGGAEFALGAASWRSREWLGAPSTLDDGDWADLVVYAADPRVELEVVRHPSLIVLRGQLVDPNLG
ncbi:MAG: amidohydrolase family protein [Propionibacteriaceae bacterium]|jgi:imidazolonepropionase-like amidohydrolase|nr:amidohydrolase family protein [Propionibacteriaceae bacterium]